MRTSRWVWSLAVIVGVLGLGLASVGEAGQFNWQQFKGTQLRVMLNRHPWQVAIEPRLKEFEVLTGMKLVVEVYPEDQFRAKTSVELQSGSGSIDVFMTMPAQEGLKYLRAGWYQPIDEFLKDASITAPEYNWIDFLEVGRSGMTSDGRIIGPPIQLETNQVRYRKDVFQKYNVKVPTTLDELEVAARALNWKAMTDDGQPGFGFVARGKRPAATSIFSGYLHAMGAIPVLRDRQPREHALHRGGPQAHQHLPGRFDARGVRGRQDADDRDPARKDPTDPASVAAALEDIEFSSPVGPVKVRACDHMAMYNFYVGTVKKDARLPDGIGVVDVKAYNTSAYARPCDEIARVRRR